MKAFGLLLVPSLLGAQVKPLPIIAALAITADCASTIWFRHHEPQTNELNPLLGKHPSDVRIVITCAVGQVATVVIGRQLKGWMRPTFYVLVSSVELNHAGINRYGVGLRLPFPL